MPMNSDAYSFQGEAADDCKGTQDKWQFVRRNQEYMQDDQMLQKLSVDLIQIYGPVSGWTASLLMDEPRAWHYCPEKKPTESEKVWRVRAMLEGYEPRKELIHIGLARKWGLVEMIDPKQDAIPSGSFIVDDCPAIWHRIEDVDAGPQSDQNDGVPTLVFTQIDLSKSISKQLTGLRKALVARQKRLKQYGLSWRTSLHADKWPTYLRVFDAYDAGLSPKEIAKEVFPQIADEYPDYAGQARVRATYQQARALVDGGYRYIVSGE